MESFRNDYLCFWGYECLNLALLQTISRQLIRDWPMRKLCAGKSSFAGSANVMSLYLVEVCVFLVRTEAQEFLSAKSA